MYGFIACFPYIGYSYSHMQIILYIYFILDVYCQYCLLIFIFLDFTIFLHMFAFYNNNIASLNLSMISDMYC